MKKIVFILLSMFLYGCGTLTTLKDPCPYIGTRYDYNMVAGNFYDGVGFKHMTRPLYFIDWPLSVVADTALWFEVHEQSSLTATVLHIIEKDEAVKGETQLVG